ncbi:MAG: outer membrane protein transport protein [Muribaculaceae bacterium]|nr:outer membrane protein transport protein [Muribaculaceae bacterium]
MKKLLFAAVAAFSALTSLAEGYQVNTFSAKQTGMGHVGVAMKLGAEGNIFNPAAVSFSDKTLDLSAGMSAIKAEANAFYNGDKFTTSNKVSTPFNISGAFRIYDNLYAGLSLYTPYGSSINWGDNWPGAILNQAVDLKVFTVQPTVSWRITPKLSVGAGLMVSWGSVDLHKGLVTMESLNALQQLMVMTGQLPAVLHTFTTTPASVVLDGSSDLAVGYNVGVMYDILPNLTFGASFRSKMQMKVAKGNAQVNYGNEVAETILGSTLDDISATNFAASMPCPYVLTFGLAYKPITNLTIEFDAQLNGWSTYKTLDIAFDGLSQFDQHLKKDYKNAWTYHIGAQYGLTKRLDIRAGLMVDTSPCNKEYYNPETPGATKIEPSVGLSFRPIPNLSIDAAFMYIYGCKVKNATGRYDDFLAKSYPALEQYFGISADGTFNADYKVSAIIPAIGVSYSF